MDRKTKAERDAEVIAQQNADADAELLRQLQERDGTPTGPTEEPETDAEPETEEDREPTIADRFIGMNELLKSERQRTRLSESTLTKLLELALNYHVWSTQRAEQQRAYQPPPSFFTPEVGESGDGEEGPVLPEPHEYLGATEEDTDTTSGDTPAESE